MPEELQAEMLKAVDLTRCHERTLQRALDKGVLPVKEICQAAIDLATKLRNEKERNPLHSYKVISSTKVSMKDTFLKFQMLSILDDKTNACIQIMYRGISNIGKAPCTTARLVLCWRLGNYVSSPCAQCTAHTNVGYQMLRTDKLSGRIGNLCC